MVRISNEVIYSTEAFFLFDSSFQRPCPIETYCLTVNSVVIQIDYSFNLFHYRSTKTTFPTTSRNHNIHSKAGLIHKPVFENEYKGLNTLKTVYKIYPENFWFYPESLHKTCTFYEFILVDTKSAKITHVLDKNDPSKIVFSKIKIFKVLNPTNWNRSLFTKKIFFKTICPTNIQLSRLLQSMVQHVLA